MDWLRERSALQSVALCRLTPIHGDTGATLNVGAAGAHFGGLKRCGSPWACPLCASAIATGRVDELARAVDRWHARGGSVAMVTLTMRHAQGDGLAELWDAKSQAWGSVRMNRRVRRAAERAGLAGTVVKTEVTHGVNGWHVHCHVLAFFEQADGVLALDAWGPAAFEAWSNRLGAWRDAAGRQRFAPDAEHGYDAALIRPGQAAQDVAKYVAKDGGPAEALAVGHEMAGHVGTKTAGAGSRSTWALLAAAVDGDEQAAAAWREWEQASKGRRALVWTKALKRELQLADVEDAELADAEPAECESIALLHPDVFKRLRRERRIALLLDVAELGYASDGVEGAQRAARALLTSLGVRRSEVVYPNLRQRWAFREAVRLAAELQAAQYAARTAQGVLAVTSCALRS